MIKFFIKNGYFTLSNLNKRLKEFSHKNADRGNKLSDIKQKNLDNGQIIIASAQMSFLVSYFGIIIGDLIPPDDPVWLFYSTIVDIINIVTLSVVTEQQILTLEMLIESHNKQFTYLFNLDLKPNHHLLTHYPRIIREMGPLKQMSCEKFESYHQVAKKHAKMVTSRLNILLTLSIKIHLNMAEKFYNSRGFRNTIMFGSQTKTKCKLLKNVHTNDTEVTLCTLNGTQYNLVMLFLLVMIQIVTQFLG